MAQATSNSTGEQGQKTRRTTGSCFDYALRPARLWLGLWPTELEDVFGDESKQGLFSFPIAPRGKRAPPNLSIRVSLLVRETGKRRDFRYPAEVQSSDGSHSHYSLHLREMSSCNVIMHQCKVKGCNKDFSRKDDRNRHIHEKHLSGNRVMCHFCGKIMLKRSMARHLDTVLRCRGSEFVRSLRAGKFSAEKE